MCSRIERSLSLKGVGWEQMPDAGRNFVSALAGGLDGDSIVARLGADGAQIQQRDTDSCRFLHDGYDHFNLDDPKIMGQALPETYQPDPQQHRARFAQLQ